MPNQMCSLSQSKIRGASAVWANQEGGREEERGVPMSWVELWDRAVRCQKCDAKQRDVAEFSASDPIWFCFFHGPTRLDLTGAVSPRG
jgi:hypothetical protein